MLLSGKRRLTENYAEVALAESKDEGSLYYDAKLSSLVDWASWTNSMADLIGRISLLLTFYLMPTSSLHHAYG